MNRARLSPQVPWRCDSCGRSGVGRALTVVDAIKAALLRHKSLGCAADTINFAKDGSITIRESRRAAA